MALCAALASLLVVACGGGDAPDRVSAASTDGRAKALALMAGAYEPPAVPPDLEAPLPASEAEAAAQAASGAGAVSPPPAPAIAVAESDICPAGTSYLTSQTKVSHYFAEDGSLVAQEEAASRSEYCGVVTTGGPISFFSDTFARGECANLKLKYAQNGLNEGGSIRWQVREHAEKCACLCRQTNRDNPRWIPGACETECKNLWGKPSLAVNPPAAASSWEAFLNGYGTQSMVDICKSSCQFSSIDGDGQVDLPLEAACKKSCGARPSRAGEIIAAWFDMGADPLTGKPRK